MTLDPIFGVHDDYLSGPPLPTNSWLVPWHIELTDEESRVRWYWLEPERRIAHRAQADDGLLGRFLQLGEGSPAQILDFARRWGPLHLCADHHLPTGHTMPLTRHVGLGRNLPHDRCDPEIEIVDGSDQPWVQESLAAWRTTVHEIEHLLLAAARVAESEIPRERDWASIRHVSPGTGDRGERIYTTASVQPPATLAEAREELTTQASRRMRWADIGIGLSWESHLQPVLNYNGLYAAVISQAAFSMWGSRPMEKCDSCGRVFIPERRRSRSTRHYCDDEECKKRSRADAARDHRQRRKEAT